MNKDELKGKEKMGNLKEKVKDAAEALKDKVKHAQQGESPAGKGATGAHDTDAEEPVEESEDD